MVRQCDSQPVRHKAQTSRLFHQFQRCKDEKRETGKESEKLQRLLKEGLFPLTKVTSLQVEFSNDREKPVLRLCPLCSVENGEEHTQAAPAAQGWGWWQGQVQAPGCEGSLC